MKHFFLLFTALTLLIGCKKNNNEPDTILADLSIVSTITPSTIIQGQDILVKVGCTGSDLCYKFARFDINEISSRQFEVKTKATYPNSKKGDVVCPDVIYHVDTSFKINASARGQYIFKFYNKNLFLRLTQYK